MQCGGRSFLAVLVCLMLLSLTLIVFTCVSGTTGGGGGRMPNNFELTSFNAASKLVSLVLRPMSSRLSSSSSIKLWSSPFF